MAARKSDFLVGLFTLLGGVALVFLALQVGNLSSFSFAPTYHVSAKFENVGSIKPRAAIKTNGVLVGRVSDISFDNKDFKAVVGMNIDAKYQFPKDSSASILTSGLIGEQYIGLTPGADDKNLANNDEIQYTQSAVVLEDLISKFLFSKASESGASSSTSAAAPTEATKAAQ